ncbi:hypothetical protein [Cyanobium sp. N5-Cardenillas]|uniref:hypothetical protein n=1 Tax=Cyanobium sp. N5-Cardenillas TaxID=2823720 RepID=UPI0020CC78A3|nr:hypothetical protein [Cyanobium sp. N5-Cardenillas]
MDVPPPTTVDTDEKQDLGVLFVHGIGQQKRGSTLVGFGEPLFRWFQERFDGIARSWSFTGLRLSQQSDWLARKEPGWRGPAGLTDTTKHFETLRSLAGSLAMDTAQGPLKPLEEMANDAAGNFVCARAFLRDAQVTTTSKDAPSHALLELQALDREGTLHETRWLMAESWWAESFAAPRFRELATWLIAIVPWTMGSHFGVRVRRSVRGIRALSGLARFAAVLSLLKNMLLLVFSLPVAVLLELGIAAIVLLGLLPIPGLSRVLVAIEGLLASFLGDSLVLVGSPMQQAAMIAQVHRDVTWLSERCKRVAVIAHSQGGAVAHRALRGARPPEVALLLTFGSGLRKLEELEQISKESDGFFGRLYLTFAAVLLIGFSLTGAKILGMLGVMATGIIGVSICIFLLIMYLFEYPAHEINWHGSRQRMQGLWWLDLYATDDPVSNGSLMDHESDVIGPDSVEIVNERSLVRDHTSYWRNTEEFVTSVSHALLHVVGEPWKSLSTLPTGSYVTGRVRRRWRVGSLSAAHLLASISALAVVWSHAGAWSQLGMWTFAQMLGVVNFLFPGLMRHPTPVPPTREVWLATCGALLTIYASSRVLRWVWERWGSHELSNFFGVRPGVEPGAPVSSWVQRFNPASADMKILNDTWFFFAMAVAPIVIAIWFAPALVGGHAINVWSALPWVSGVGLIATVIVLLGMDLASARARRVALEREQAVARAASVTSPETP